MNALDEPQFENILMTQITSLFRAWAIFALAVGLIGCGNGRDTITAAELAMRIESGNPPVILDVRTTEEYAEEQIPGAINIPHLELGERLAELADYRQEEIVVHCRSGKRAGLAETLLRDAGFADVRDLEGHMLGWTEGGYPVDRLASKPMADDE